ncbi:MAG: hypothetical protein ACKO7D_07810 [Bacteroidota bacterium]
MQLQNWTSFLAISLIVLLGIISYRKLLQYLSRNRIRTEEYINLYDLELSSITGEIEFYFTLPTTKFVQFEILDSNWLKILELASKQFEPGGHIIRFDSSSVSPGTYYYGIRTEGQVLHKKFIVE